MTHVSSPFAGSFAKNADREYTVRGIVGQAPAGGADVGEVLAAVGQVKNTDTAGWARAWRDLGERVDRYAADATGPTARWASLRAANYLAVAADAAGAAGDDAAASDLFAAHRAAWERFAAALPSPAERVDVRLDEAVMPGFFFRGGAGARATVVFVNGSDGSVSGLWGTGVAAALERGYHAYVFDGPGQQSMLVDQGVLFRPDWENVLRPVVDALVARRDVDAERLVVWGISQAGYWVPRALSAEHRFAAAIVDPGVVDVSTSWFDHIPASLVRLLDAGKDARFDNEMAMGMRVSPSTAATWAFRARPLGTAGYAATLRRIREYALTDAQTGAITTPMLITSPEDEQFWPGQSVRLAEMAPRVSEVIAFTAAEGASGHCEPLARTLVHERVLDGLSVVLARRQ